MLADITKYKVGIIGLGLIGGSIALNLIQKNIKVIGINNIIQDIHKDAGFYKLSSQYEILEECDLIFLCTPLNKIPIVLTDIQPYLKKDTIISDVGSIKQNICEIAEKVCRKGIYFIGGHPMAGTEKQGFENAFATLFDNKKWVLINSTNSIKPLINIITLLGAEIIYTTPKEHDKAVAIISHLPVLISIAIQNTLIKCEDKNIKKLAEQLASSGFESMTRLARGNQELNADLLNLNNKNIKLYYELFTKEVKNLVI